MDRNSFWREVIEIIKHPRHTPDPVENLSEKRMAQLESNIFAHIEQQFSDDTVVAAKPDNSVAPEPRKYSLLERVKTLLQIPDGLTGSPVLAITMFALLSAGALTFILSNNRMADSHFKIPSSVASANLEQFIEIPQNGTKALASTPPSDRRSAFLTGVALADLNLIGDNEKESAQEIAIWFQQTTNSTPAVNAESAVETVQSQAAHFSSDEKSSLWFKHGYSVEIVQLAAKSSLADMNTSVLADALAFYKNHSTHPIPKSHTVDLAKQYIQNHEQLINTASTELSTPNQIQEIVKITDNMKVLLQ